jgi:hypothetical protein
MTSDDDSKASVLEGAAHLGEMWDKILLPVQMTNTAGLAGQLAGHAVAWAFQASAGVPVLTMEQLGWAAFNLATEAVLPDVVPNVVQAGVVLS